MNNSKFLGCLAILAASTSMLVAACGCSSSGPDLSVTFTVTFDTAGGSTVPDQEVNNTSFATKPETPTKEGHTFDNWYADENHATVFDFEKVPITADWTIYANWIQNVTPDDPDDPLGPLPPEESGVKYFVTGMPEWVTDDGCIIFAWAWEAGKDGSWVALTYGEGDKPTEASFVVDHELAGFLLARCKEGTTTPSWQEKDHVAGRVYNQTEDITVESGKTSYTCSAWKDYNPA